ncbi:MAG: branched-chain amino acid ABC transporter permease [Candidatus Peribacteraceae bacterium]|nr:branched-chain amino acid ABC transporter permease [Candidatus Peribacteraceae bacterium]
MSFFLHILILIGYCLPIVLAFNLIFGKGKILHFGPMGVSAATSYAIFVVLMNTHSFLLAILFGLLISILISLFFSWLSLRLEQDSLGVMSLAVHLTIIVIITNWTSVTCGALGIPKIPRLSFMESIEMFALVTTIYCAIFLYFLYKVDKSSFGRKLEALAEHSWHAKSLGINRAYVHAIAFLILGFAHVFGGFFAYTYLRFLNTHEFGFQSLIFIVMAVVAGKPGSFKGVTLAVILLILLKEGIRFIPLAPGILGPVRLITFGIILFVAVWIRRDTLFPQERLV